MNIIESFLNLFEKMKHDSSYIIGAVTTLSLAIPAWLSEDKLTVNHVTFLGCLIVILIMDMITGMKLAKMNDSKRTSVANDGITRDFLIVMMCVISYLLGSTIGVGTITFVFLTSAFIWNNLESVIANSILLGWGDNMPIWLFDFINKRIKSELKAKKIKYQDAPSKSETIKNYLRSEEDEDRETN